MALVDTSVSPVPPCGIPKWPWADGEVIPAAGETVSLDLGLEDKKEKMLMFQPE